MDNLDASANADRAFVASDQAGSRLDPSGFNPLRGCELCAGPEDGTPCYPMYGVAPHECYWRKGPQFAIGQSTLIPMKPEDCFVPELDAHEDWSHFQYPSACGVYYCPNCQWDRYQCEWDALVARIGPPPAIGMEAGTGETEGLDPKGDSPVAQPIARKDHP